MKVKGARLLSTRLVTEADGQLWVTEAGNQIPFEIKRIFCVMNVVSGKSRGDHATKKTNLILFPICGSCDVVVDDGENRDTYHMDDPTKGLYIDAMIWRSMQNFTPDCIMMAVCDRPFEPGNETYDDYEEYLAALK
ncbi:MAG: FdtA/QdtA family cupin domain-containing protein [Lachnospiraceae bacterium]|nr:FdtA/QdtA family cupin domain-containing protein [Lachnospiraceae bacterium]MCR5267070.1 FdtA/QdtA family cupin domain-containing protein [Lachnospiraceae bacterium]